MATKKFRTRAGVFHVGVGHIPEGHIVELEMDSGPGVVPVLKDTPGTLLLGDPRADLVPDDTPITYDMKTGTDLRAEAAAKAAALVTAPGKVETRDPKTKDEK